MKYILIVLISHKFKNIIFEEIKTTFKEKNNSHFTPLIKHFLQRNCLIICFEQFFFLIIIKVFLYLFPTHDFKKLVISNKPIMTSFLNLFFIESLKKKIFLHEVYTNCAYSQKKKMNAFTIHRSMYYKKVKLVSRNAKYCRQPDLLFH